MSTTDPYSANTTLISLIGSVADNKSALGRRYGEWAVSAPTIESAVALAAMAQDELGHARSTYPVLAKLGVQRDEDGLDAGTPIPALRQEFPDWASVIAANLTIDAVLATFLASALHSSNEPLAQRARKILQEEGAHRVHAEAWLTRICQRGGDDAELLLRRVGEFWVQASRWLGPDSDPGYEMAVHERLVSESATVVRRRVNDWLDRQLEEFDYHVPAVNISDFSSWDPETRQ